MRKIALGILSVALILGAGTAVFAATTDTEEGLLKFQEMLPYIQKMHPDLSDSEIEDMYNVCHGSDGQQNTQAQKTSNPVNMMNQF